MRVLGDGWSYPPGATDSAIENLKEQVRAIEEADNSQERADPLPFTINPIRTITVRLCAR